MRVVIARVKTERNNLGLARDQHAKLDATVAEIEGELKKEKPDDGKLKGMFASLRTILEGAAGSAAGQGIIDLIGKIPW
jgi:hypothetical protein